MSNSLFPDHSTSDKKQARLDTLVTKVRDKLKNFAVKDQHGELVGEVRDVQLTADRQLQFLVSLPDAHKGFRLVLLTSKSIHSIDSPNRSVLTHLSAAQMAQLPESSLPATGEAASSTLPSKPVTLPFESSSQLNSQQSSNSTSNPMESFTDSTPTSNSTPLPLQNSLEFDRVNDAAIPHVVEEEAIRLLEERLVVDRSKHKIGEVIVRKAIETQIVEVPVRREKLIVEQISPEHRQLAEIDLSQGDLTAVELANAMATDSQQGVVRGEFASPGAASQFLDAIAKTHRHGCEKIQVEIVLSDPNLQETYANWLAQYAAH
ncbi:YsnF/AvaK domain-containing protein [Trichocoleus desertorum AS-A10]|uniref:YsnF/AvaK domain-containing protein n=1 Tax=Trichocoleus desertorum TaxID=1481672 RepID=UPI003297E93B